MVQEKLIGDITILSSSAQTVDFYDTSYSQWDYDKAFKLDGKTDISIGINIKKKTSANNNNDVSVIIDDITLEKVNPTTKINEFTDNGTDNKWSTKENWSLDKIPNFADNIIIPDSKTVKIINGTTKAYSVEIKIAGKLINKAANITVITDITNNGTFSV